MNMVKRLFVKSSFALTFEVDAKSYWIEKK